jgi:hypothetical protein
VLSIAAETYGDLFFFDLFINRHMSGDWGECMRKEKAKNEAALGHDGGIISLFTTPKGQAMRRSIRFSPSQQG